MTTGLSSYALSVTSSNCTRRPLTPSMRKFDRGDPSVSTQSRKVGFCAK